MVKNRFIKIGLCMLEVFMIFGFGVCLPFILMGVFYPNFYEPVLGVTAIVCAGVLGADMVLRMIDGVGFSW